MPEERTQDNLPFENSPEIYGNQRIEAYKKGFNQALSKINTELITQKILEVIKKEIHDCMCEHNEVRHGDKPDDAYDRVLDLFTNYE